MVAPRSLEIDQEAEYLQKQYNAEVVKMGSPTDSDSEHFVMLEKSLESAK